MSEVNELWYQSELNFIVTSNIRAEAARAGLSQAEIARRLRFTRVAISNRWNGKVEWKLSDLELIGELLDIEPWELLKPVRRTKNARKLASVPSLYTARDSNPEPIEIFQPLLRLVS